MKHTLRALLRTFERLPAPVVSLVLLTAACDGPAHEAQLVGTETSQAISALSTGEAGVYHPAKDSGKCLDVNMGNPKNGTPVQLATCYANDAAQVWTFTGSQLKVFGNKCLDVTEGRRQNGTKLQIWDCDSNNVNQRWALEGQTFVWQNKYCLDLTEGNTNDLTLIQIWECGGGNVNQQWIGGPADSTIPMGSSAPVAQNPSPSPSPTTSNNNQGSQDGGNGGSGVAADAYSSNTIGASTTTLSRPGNSLNVLDFGVKNDGNGDYTQALQSAFDAAASQGKTVWIPAGTYNHSGVIKAQGIRIVGAGTSTILRATNQYNSALTLTGQNPSLINVTTQVAATNRSSQPYDCAVLVIGARNAKISYVDVQGASANGFRIDSSDGCTLTKSLVNGTNADGVALVNGATNNRVSYTQVSNASDDSFSSNSYPGERQNSGNTFERCYAGPNYKQGRGFCMMGSVNETITQSVSVGSLWHGMVAGTDPGSTTQSGRGFTFSNNLIMNNASGLPVMITTDGGFNQAGNAGSLANVSGTQTSGDPGSVLGWGVIGNLPSPSSFNNYQGGGPGSSNTPGNRQ